MSRHFGDRSLPRYPRHVPPATIVVNDAGSGGEPVAAMLLKTTPAGVRHVQMPSGRVLRFDKLGFHMGDQRSTFSIEAA